MLALSPDGKRLFVTSASPHGDGVTEIDTHGAHVVRTIRTGKAIAPIAITKEGRLYVSNGPANAIDIYEGKDLATHRRISKVCERPHGITLSPDESRLFVACFGDADVAVIDAHAETVTRKVFVEASPDAVAVKLTGAT